MSIVGQLYNVRSDGTAVGGLSRLRTLNDRENVTRVQCLVQRPFHDT